jgi:peroxiredoxin
MSETSALTVAPRFALPNQLGETRTLDSYLEKGRLLLIFHRGTW